jgi:hypothetical protein
MLDMAEKIKKTSLTILDIAWQPWLRCSNRYTQGVAASAGVLLLDALLPEQREMLTDMIKGTIPFDPDRLCSLAGDAFVTLAKATQQKQNSTPAESRKSG